MKLGANDVSAVKIGATDVNKVYLGSNLVWEAGGGLLLDDYPNAAAAYSLRKLRNAYAGSSIKVRRSSDNTEQDIGFVANELDTASLLSFVGAGDGFVTVWYDQSGNGINSTQGSASKQPILVSNGAVNELNGKPTMQFISAFVMDLNLTQYPFTSGGSATEKSIFAVAENNATVNQNLYNIADTRDIYALTYNRSGNNTYAFLGANYGVIGGNITGQNIISSLAISPSSETFNNTVEGTSSNLVRANFSSLSIGSRGGSFPMDGNIQEMVMYPSDQSTNRENIETNINDYYNVYATSILDFSPFNVWDSEHITINGTTTTFEDFNNVGSAYDLSNPAASNQPVFNSSSSNFNSQPSITFEGAGDYVINNVANFRNTDSSGLIVSVWRLISGATVFDFMVSNNSATTPYLNQGSTTGNNYRTIHNSGGLRQYRNSTDIKTGSPSTIIANSNSGTEYKLFTNGVESTTMISGANDGSIWFDDGTTLDNISIGARVTSLLATSNIEWCFTGYFPYTSDAKTIEIINFLKTKYGIS
ncbi:hypothetical protein N9515_10050 [Vicingaceae bacterium]|nr:hypothetical protein [Vicingaceae bacterium]